MYLTTADSHRSRLDWTRWLGLAMLVVSGPLHPAICRAAEGPAVTMTYSYSNLFDGSLNRASGFSPYEMLLAVEEGLSLWSQVVPLTFVEQVDSGPPVSDEQYLSRSYPQIRIGHHDLTGNVLAHAYYPGFGGLASDLHLDSSDRTWSESLFLTTVTHELGHTIGIDHIEGVDSIMNSSLGGANMISGLGRGRLFEPEILAAQEIWGSGSGEVITQRTWSSDDSSDWIEHENWEQGWRPTNHSDTTIQTNAQVRLSAANQVVRSLTMAGGQNELQIADRGSLKIRNDLTMGIASGGRPLIASGATARLLLPIDDREESTWFSPEFDDQDWMTGATGIGFDRSTDFDGLISTDVESLMFGRNSSLYTRIEFEVADPEQLAFLDLGIQYDDGFVAYLNGTRIASANSPTTVRWNSASTRNRSDEAAVQPEHYDLTSDRSLLHPGTNVLAIQGLNQRSNSSDLLLLPELRGGAIENVLRVSGGSLQIEGSLLLAQAPASLSHIVLDDGILEVAGQITTGAGTSRLEMHGGELRMTEPSDPQASEVPGRLTVDHVGFYGGRFEGIGAVQSEFHHHAGRLDLPNEESPFQIDGTYQMEGQAILEILLPSLPDRPAPPLQVTGQATLGGTLAILAAASLVEENEDGDGDENPRGVLQSTRLISANLLEEEFDHVTWNGQPFESGHQAAGQFRFLDYQADGLQLLTCRALPGDASGDCRFDVTDLVQVLQFGQYEDGIAQNSDWTQGDWNGDREFTASDLVMALETGLYEQNGAVSSVPAVPEPSGVLLVLSSLLVAVGRWRRFRANAMRPPPQCLFQDS